MLVDKGTVKYSWLTLESDDEPLHCQATEWINGEGVDVRLFKGITETEFSLTIDEWTLIKHSLEEIWSN